MERDWSARDQSSEAAIDGFELFGDRVRYRSPLGMTVVASRRRTWVY